MTGWWPSPYRAAGPIDDDPASWNEGSLALRLDGAAFKGSARGETRQPSTRLFTF